MTHRGLVLWFSAFAAVLPTQVGATVVLLSADNFAVLGGSTVTSTGGTVLNGDLGVHPGTAITGFPPGLVNGTIHSADAVAAQAQTDALAAYQALAGQSFTFDLTGQNLGGLTLTPGVHHYDSSAQLTGILVLDALGDINARFDFLIGSSLTTAGGSSILLLNGAQADNVFWQVGSSATLGTTTDFLGSILADQSITLNTGANLLGRAFALNGAVTLDHNRITVPNSMAAVPEPATFLAGGVLAAFVGWDRMRARRRRTERA